MALLTLRGIPLPCGERPLEAVLFDKDGTLSHSEPMLLALAQARVVQCLALAGLEPGEQERHQTLRDLLHRAYGLTGEGIHPAGTLAVAHRDHNLVATATALAQVGLGWPDAMATAEEAFERADGLRRGKDQPRPSLTPGLRPLLNALQQAGVLCGVISNDHVHGIEAFLAAHDLQKQVQAIWSAEHQPRKPDPGAVHGLCGLLGVTAAGCALIGDADSDLRMARAAGVPVALGYRAGWQRPVELDRSFPHLDHWRELGVIHPEGSAPPPPTAPSLATERPRPVGISSAND